MHIETWSSDAQNKIEFTKGELRPCKPRELVDEAMGKYEDELVNLFPEWKGRFKRNARVISKDLKVCSNEP